LLLVTGLTAALQFQREFIQRKLSMFSFTHTVEELRDLIQCMEARIASMQTHVQKLVSQANEQQQQPVASTLPQPPAVDPSATTDTSTDQPQS